MGKKYESVVEELINLKDRLKREGYSWMDYECINDACNILSHLGEDK